MSEMSWPTCKIGPDHSNTSTVTESLKIPSFHFSYWRPRQASYMLLRSHIILQHCSETGCVLSRLPSPLHQNAAGPKRLPGGLQKVWFRKQERTEKSSTGTSGSFCAEPFNPHHRQERVGSSDELIGSYLE